MNTKNTSQNPLLPLRDKITTLDTQLLSLLHERRQIAREVIATKIAHNIPLRDREREEQLIQTLIQRGTSLDLSPDFITKIYRLIIQNSVDLQADILQQNHEHSSKQEGRFAFLGPKGSYSYFALTQYTERAPSSTAISCSSFADIFRSVEEGDADYAIVPIENTSSGSINEVYDLLQKTSLFIIDELFLPIDHALLAAPSATLETITTLYSHPQPFTQCSHYLQLAPHIQTIFCESSAEAMRRVVLDNSNHVAAIGHKEAGQLYGLNVLQDHLANQKINVTRFIILSKTERQVSSLIPAKTTLLMTTGQQAGALVDALTVFQRHNIAMTKLESRPIHGTPWKEMFYIDLNENSASPSMKNAIQMLHSITDFVKCLGSYPAQDRPDTL